MRGGEGEGTGEEEEEERGEWRQIQSHYSTTMSCSFSQVPQVVYEEKARRRKTRDEENERDGRRR